MNVAKIIETVCDNDPFCYFWNEEWSVKTGTATNQQFRGCKWGLTFAPNKNCNHIAEKEDWDHFHCNNASDHGWRAFPKWGAQVRVKKSTGSFRCLNWQLRRPSIQIWRQYLYTIWKSKLYYFRKNKSLWKLIGEPPEIQTGCYRGDPGQQLH